MPSKERSFYLLNTHNICVIFSITERSVLMALVFYYKDTLEKVTIQRTKLCSAALRTVPTKYKGFCAKLGPRGKSSSLQGLLESTMKNRGSHTFFSR